jgi:hypothetical protein
MKRQLSRRQFLKSVVGGLGATALTRLIGFFPEYQSTFALPAGASKGHHLSQDQVEGLELFHGFLLLPEEAPLPALAHTASHIDLHGTDSAFAGMSIQLDSITELKQHISFPVYIPTELPPEMQFASAGITKFVQSGEIWGVYANFTTNDLANGQITTWARPEYPKPFPVWPVRFPFAHDDPIRPEKVSFTPSPGILLPSMLGYSLLWIEHDVLYSLFVENNASREMAATIASSLVHL